MITAAQVMREMARAVLADPAVCAICDKFPEPQVVLVGHAAEEALQPSDKRVRISLVHGGDYDMGYAGEDLSIPVKCTLDLTTKDTVDAGRIREYVGPMLIDDLGAAIIAAVKAISGLGDEVRTAILNADASETWPLCRATIDFVFVCKKGTAFTPSIS